MELLQLDGNDFDGKTRCLLWIYAVTNKIFNRGVQPMYYNQVPILTHQRPPAYDLTGTYRGDDGGIYYIRHLDNNRIWWVGLSDNGSGHNWTNVFEGEVSYHWSGAVEFSGNWFDVPRGTNRGNGILGFSVRFGNLVKTYQDAGFSVNTLTKIS